MVRLRSGEGVFYLGLRGQEDVLLLTGDGGRVRTHRAVLAAACHVFVGAQQDDEQVVVLPDYKREDVEAFVEVLVGLREVAEGEGVRALAGDAGFRWGEEAAGAWPECEVKVKEEVGEGAGTSNGDWKEEQERKRADELVQDDDDYDYDPRDDFVVDDDDEDEEEDEDDEDYEVELEYRPRKRRRGRAAAVSSQRGGRRRGRCSDRPPTQIHRDEEQKRFLCPEKECHFSDERLELVCRHLAKVHGDFVCQHCFFTTSSPKGLPLHLKRSHASDDKPNRLCTQCWRFFETDDKVTAHLLSDSCVDVLPSVSRPGWSQCPEEGCDYSHPNPAGIIPHLMCTHSKRQCIYCGEFLNKVEDLTRHIRILHQDQPSKPCFICDQYFESQVERKIHMVREHTAKDMVKLEDNPDAPGGAAEKCFTGSCDFSTNDRLEMVRHGMVEHKGKAMCPFCGIVNFGLSSWKNHQNNYHTNFACHMCPTCYQVFWHDEDLRRHRQVDNCQPKDETMMCHKCGNSIRLKTFSGHIKKCKGIPQRPSKRHTTVPTFRRMPPARKDADGFYHCGEEGCNFAADKSSKVYTHFNRKHNRQDCPHCGRNLSAYQIFQHIALKHTGETNVKCEHCPQKFYNRTLLRQHVEEVHVAAAVYICEFCSQGFTSRRQLVNHRSEKHTRTRKWPCTVCGRSFRSRTLIKPHMIEAHGLKDD